MTISVDVHLMRGRFEIEASFAIETAGVTALFGPSGAGKSSLVHAIAGLLRPERGSITLNGRTVLDTARGIDVPSEKRRVGYVFQDSRLFPHLNVERNLRFGWRRAERRADEKEFAEVLEMLGIAALRDRRPGTLSGGEKQRVAIGRALLASPDILLMDEPMASLDAGRREEILPYLERLREERRLPILYVSHALDEVARLADQIVVLTDGRVGAQGSVFDLMPRIDPRSGVVLAAHIVRHLPDGLTELAFAGGPLFVHRLALAEGSAVRVRIAASDVLLALHPPEGISANNVIKARIAKLSERKGDLVDAELAAGPATLIARITRASAKRLGLISGTEVFAVIKAVTVDAPIATGDQRAI